MRALLYFHFADSRIKGFGCQAGGLFFQVKFVSYLLPVNFPQLLDNISKDERHYCFEITSILQIESRRFPNFHMALATYV